MNTLVEDVAKLEHEQWIAWSGNIAKTEAITPARLYRWKMLWRPYSELTEAEKDQVREWAHKVLSLIQNHPETLERRRKDFYAGAQNKVCKTVYTDLGPQQVLSMVDDFNDYLAAEKEQGK